MADAPTRRVRAPYRPTGYVKLFFVIDTVGASDRALNYARHLDALPISLAAQVPN